MAKPAPFALNASTPRIDVIDAQGGLDLTTPPVRIGAGPILAGVNFVAESIGGYTRIPGYERFDGQAAPSEASYLALLLTPAPTASYGDSVTIGGTAYTVLGAEGDELYVYDLPTTAVAIGDTFTLNGVSHTVVEVSSAGAADLKTHAVMRSRAADERRKAITAPPGVGAVLGVVEHPSGDGVVAFRADANGVVEAYNSTSTGWKKIPRAIHLPFNNGTATIKVGDTVTGATSGASATVDEVIVLTGGFSTTTPATGVLILSSVTGTFSANENLNVGTTTVATATDTQAAVVLPANMDVFSDVYNFSGASGTNATYFVDRVTDYVYRYDGKSIVAVSTGMPSGVALERVMAYKSRLYVTAKSSLLVSAPGSPFKFDAVEGAAELAVGADITNLVAERGTAQTSAIVITTTRSIHILYGNSEVDWQLQALTYDMGALPDTAALVNGDVIFASESGLYTIEAVQRYGNFSVNAVSKSIAPLYDELRPYFKRALTRSDASQYRLYCTDGRVLVATQVSNVTSSGAVLKSLSFTLVSYKDYNTEEFVYTNVCKAVSGVGGERFFVAGGTYVFELDKGTSFDGAPIFAYFVTAFFDDRALLLRKRYKRLRVSAISRGFSEASLQYDVSPTAYDGGISRDKVLEVYPKGAWLDAASWGSFVWSAGATPEIAVDAPGTGRAMSVMVKSLSSISDPFTIQSFTVQYTIGRVER